MKRHLLGMLFVVCSLGIAPTATAKEPSWSGTVVARGEQREQIEATDILKRPYRPLHFYGNTVRRQYYRGTARPTVGDFARGATALVWRW